MEVSEEEFVESLIEKRPPPEMVTPVPRFRDNVIALPTLTVPEEPPWYQSQGQQALMACYLMRDVSGKCFGSALWCKDELLWETGNFAVDYQTKSSNYQEASNLVIRLERMAEDGAELDGREVFLLTESAVFDDTFYQSHSDLKLLNGLVLQVRQLEAVYLARYPSHRHQDEGGWNWKPT